VTPVRNFVLAIWAAAWFAAPSPATPQTEPPKPPPAAEKKPPVKQEKPATPPAPRREAPRTGAGEERPRSDVPVSFPVDI
jgi:hypothetical protein